MPEASRPVDQHPRPERRKHRGRRIAAGVALASLAVLGMLNFSRDGGSDQKEDQVKTEQVEDSVEGQTQVAITDLAADIMKIKENAHASDSKNYGVNVETETGVYGLSVIFPPDYEGDYNPEDAEGIYVNVGVKDPRAEGGYREDSRIIISKLANEDPGNQEDVYSLGVGFMTDEGFKVAQFTTGEYPTYNDTGDLTLPLVKEYSGVADEIVRNASQAAAGQNQMVVA